MSEYPGSSALRASRWSTRDVVHIALVVVGVYAGARLIAATHVVLFAVFLGVLFGLAVGAGADWLRRFRIPRAVGAPFIVLAFLALLGGFGTWIGPTVREQTGELRVRLPEALDKLDRWVDDGGGGFIATLLRFDAAAPDSRASRDTTGAVAGGPAPAPAPAQPGRPSLRERLLQQLSGARHYFLPFLSSTLAAIAGTILVIFLAIYTAIDPGTYRRGILAVIPASSRPRGEHVLTAIATTLRRWLVTQLIAMVAIGVVTTVVLFALGVRAAVPLGILAGLLEFVPTLGPILSALPAIAMGFVDSPEKALAVTVAYVAIQFIENHVLIPLLMREGVNLPPALTIVTQALMAVMFGFLGLLVAVPILAAVMITVKTLATAPRAAAAGT